MAHSAFLLISLHPSLHSMEASPMKTCLSVKPSLSPSLSPFHVATWQHGSSTAAARHAFLPFPPPFPHHHHQSQWEGGEGGGEKSPHGISPPHTSPSLYFEKRRTRLLPPITAFLPAFYGEGITRHCLGRNVTCHLPHLLIIIEAKEGGWRRRGGFRLLTWQLSHYSDA